jgi:UPF0755 protein
MGHWRSASLNLSVQAFKIIVIVVLALFIVVTTQRALSHYLDQASGGSGNQEVIFTIAEQESVDDVANRLKDAGLIRSATYFKFKMRLSNADTNLRAGRFSLRQGMTVNEIIDSLTSPESVEVLEVRFQEGWRTEEYVDRLLELGLISSSEQFMDAINDGQWNYDFLASRPSDATLEGFLFPDTYQFRADATPEDVINTLLSTFDRKVPPELRAKADALGYNFYQVVSIASIIEREAVVPDERPIIASVYYNRLEQNMPLQADPTVQYAVGHPGDWWPELTQEDSDQDSPYNTYQYPGLPGPICNPSLSSIEAALNPAQTDYLYFVAKDDGSGAHVFATTYDEHLQNIQQSQAGQ